MPDAAQSPEPDVKRAAATLTVAAAMTAAAAQAEPIGYRDLLERPSAQADERLAYGPGDLQFGELWLPKGKGPHPVVVLIHGGCWRADLPGLELMDHVAEDLRTHGKAVWNIEYRRIGHDGGGYPGTFQDVAQAVDHLRQIAGPHRLDLDRVVLSGHSAGGHLAVWAMARPRLPAASPLRTTAPLTARGVVSLAGIIDLAAYRADGPDACGGPGTIDALVGAPARQGDVYGDTSPPAMLPLGVPQTIVSGDLDHITPSRFGAAYGAAAARAGDAVSVIELPRSGHFELIDPTSPAWARIRAEIDRLIR